MNEGVGKCNKLRLQEALPEVDYAGRPDAGSEASNDSSEGVPASGRSEGANYQVSTTQWYAVTLYERIDWQLVLVPSMKVVITALQRSSRLVRHEKMKRREGWWQEKKMVGCKDKKKMQQKGKKEIKKEGD